MWTALGSFKLPCIKWSNSSMCYFMILFFYLLIIDWEYVLRFTQFKLEGDVLFRKLGTGCYFDYVRVFDENDNDSQDLGTFCGNLNQNLPLIKSKTNTMYVHFKSDSSEGFNGFVGEISFSYGNWSY